MLITDPLTNDIDMDRGDYFDPEFTITDADGVALDVSTATFLLTVKASVDDVIGSAVFQLAPGDFDMTNAASGIVKAQGLETLTQSLDGDYLYDLEMTLAGKTRTVVRPALLRIRKDVTTPGSAPTPPAPIPVFPSGYVVVVPFYTFQSVADGGDGLYHKWTAVADGFGGLTWEHVGSSATYPF